MKFKVRDLLYIGQQPLIFILFHNNKMYVNKSDPIQEQNQMMFSRAGKSTNNLYLAFQDKDKLKNIQSRVATYLGRATEEAGKGSE